MKNFMEFYIIMDDETQGCCVVICEEFHADNFNLTHEPIDDFLTSQWQTSEISYKWLIYRWFLAFFFIGFHLECMIFDWYGGRYFIYLTSWGFSMCTIAVTLGAILVTIDYFKPDKFDDNSKVFQIYWVMHWSALVMAVIISFMYWAFVFPSLGIKVTKDFVTTLTGINNIVRHVFNAVFMLLDHMLVAFPSRLLHFIYPLCIGLAYSLFTFIYYVAGGLDKYGHPYVYTILNWTHPATAGITVICTMLSTVIASVLLFGLFKLRVLIYYKLFPSE